MRHFIIAKLKDPSKRNELQAPVQELFNQTLEIDGIEDVKVHVCNVDISNRYDLMIEITMTREALEEYKECEAHKTWKREYGDLLAAKTIFDCE